MVKQLRHIDKAIKLDAQMQYGHAEGEKGLKALREQVYTRIQMVYYNKVPKPDPAPQPEQQRQSTSPPQREMTLREAEKKLQEAKRFFPDDVENAQKLVDKLKSREPVTKVQPQAQQQQPAAQPPAQPPLPPGSISLREAEKELRDAQKFFPTDVKNAQNLVDRIKGGEIIMREQWRREQEREHHKNIKLAAPPPTKTVPVPPKTKPLPQKPGEESVNKDEQTSPRKKM